MASSPSAEDTYMFKRDHRSMARLSYNHWLHTQLTGYLIHPSISSHNASLRIADIGTGNAIYPICLSAQLQSASRIDGFDISLTQFPPKEWLPQNVHLCTHDVFTPFPAGYNAVFDVVHVRFFMTLVNNKSLGPLIRNLMSLLKPGGYLQWSEADMFSTSAAAISPSSEKGAAEKLIELMKKPGPGAETDWVPQLGTRISEVGLEVVADDRIPVPDAYRMLFNVSHLITFEDVTTAHATSTAAFTKGNEMLDTLKSDFLYNGVSIDQSFVCVVARRPL